MRTRAARRSLGDHAVDDVLPTGSVILDLAQAQEEKARAPADLATHDPVELPLQ
jgi:hypothetical protein